MWYKRRNSEENDENQSYWQSYSDMMAALLLMFILIMALTLLRSLRLFEKKNADLEQQRQTITQQQERLDKQSATLQQQANTLKEQEGHLQKVTDELSNISKLVSVKSDIIGALSHKFKDSDLVVYVDKKTGAITLDAGIFFSPGSSQISSAGKEFLQEFLPQYLSVLLSDEFYSSISEIIIEGHTDTIKGYMYNLDLSQNRAYSVAAYCLNESNGILQEHQINILRNILTANGKSFSDPVYNQDGTVNLTASRRVVFKFRLKDDEMVSAIQELLGSKYD